MTNPKLIRITTVPKSLRLLKGQLKFMASNFNVVAISSSGKMINDLSVQEGVPIKIVEMERSISPIKDLRSIILLYKIFRKEKPNIVHTHTPKAGFVGMIASCLANVPIRVHTVAGLPLLVETGIKRKVLNFIEFLTYKCATKVYPNSFELSRIIIEQKITNKEKIKVIGNGSSNGVDINHFTSSAFTVDELNKLKKELDIKPEDFVYVYVGRMVKDKGLNELISSFKKLSFEYTNIKLLLVGGFAEKGIDPIKEENEKEIGNNKNIITVGYQADVRPYFLISNVLTFPSYREGFPNVVLQAGALEIPSIVTNINGCNEIIEDGVNGYIISPQNENVLYEKMKYVYNNQHFLNNMKTISREKIMSKYSQSFVWGEILKEYQSLLKK